MALEPLIITYGKPDGFRNIHLGHLSGVVLHADAYARYCRAKGRDAWLISGTDGYGAAVYQHTFAQYGRIPSTDELRTSVQRCHLKQRATLEAYHVSNDYYGLDTDPAETKRIKRLCDKLLNRLKASDSCVLRKEIDHYDPVLKCPLGRRQLYRDVASSSAKYRSRVTGALTTDVEVENWYLSLEGYRHVIEASLRRFDDYMRDKHMISYVYNRLKEPLPDYRLTTHQPWAVPVGDESRMKYQVWVESLLSPIAYVQQRAVQKGTRVLNPRYVQFIAEDSLFFYTIIQPVLWHVLCPDLELSALFCNKTRRFVDEIGHPCLMNGDELLQRFSVEQIRVCLISRGNRNTTIALNNREMNRLWKGYDYAACHIQNHVVQADLDKAHQYRLNYEECLKHRNFSKAADIADDYFHSAVPVYETCAAIMNSVVPGFLCHSTHGRGIA